MATKAPEGPEIRGDTAGMKIKWDDSNMKSSYANVCNVTSTREEVVMLFGMNQAWNRGQKEVTIHLTDLRLAVLLMDFRGDRAHGGGASGRLVAARYFFASAPPWASMLSVPNRFSYSLTTLPSSMLSRLAAYGLTTMRSVRWMVTSF